jgi:hypothetical protein
VAQDLFLSRGFLRSLLASVAFFPLFPEAWANRYSRFVADAFTVFQAPCSFHILAFSAILR